MLRQLQNNLWDLFFIIHDIYFIHSSTWREAYGQKWEVKS